MTMTATVRALCVFAALLQACSAGCISTHGCGHTHPHDVSDLDLDLELDDYDSDLDAVYSAPPQVVQVLHYGEPCACKKSHSYALQKPIPDPPEPTRTYAYEVQAPPAPVPVALHNYDYRLEVPVEDPDPKTYTYSYEVSAPPPPRPVRLRNYDYKLELPVPEKQPLLKDLVSEVDRVLLPRKDCNVERRSARMPLDWSPENSGGGYYLGDEYPEDEDVLHLGGPYEPTQIPSSDSAEVFEQFHDYGQDYKVLRSGGVYRETVNGEDDEDEEDESEETLELEGIPAGSVVHSAYHSGNQRGHDFRSHLRRAPATIDGIARTRYYRAARGNKTKKYSDTYDRQIQTPTHDCSAESGKDMRGEELLEESHVYPSTLNHGPGRNNRITGALYLNSGNRILKAKGESELDEYNWGEYNEHFYPDNEVNGGKCETESEYAANDSTFEETGIAIREHSIYRDDQPLENVHKTLLQIESSEKNNQINGYSSNSELNVVVLNAVNNVSKTTTHEKQNSQEHEVYDVSTSFKDVLPNNIEELRDESFLNSQHAEREITGYGDAMTLEGATDSIFDGIGRNTDKYLLEQISLGKYINSYGKVLTNGKSYGAVSHDNPLDTNDDFDKWKTYWDEYKSSYSVNHLSEPPASNIHQATIDFDNSNEQGHLPEKETTKRFPDSRS